jgi:hypothetical protein
MTYKADKDKVTFEISAKTGWGAIGFNNKGKMVRFMVIWNSFCA